MKVRKLTTNIMWQLQAPMHNPTHTTGARARHEELSRKRSRNVNREYRPKKLAQ